VIRVESKLAQKSGTRDEKKMVFLSVGGSSLKNNS